MRAGAQHLEHGDQHAEVGDQHGWVHEVEGVRLLSELVFIAAARAGVWDG